MSGAVAVALAVVALWPLWLVGLLTAPLPRLIVAGVGAAIAATFLARGVAGYAPAWRRHFTAEPFASRDVRYFSPLCLILAAGFAVLLLRGATL
jgi:hypothetical protein